MSLRRLLPALLLFLLAVPAFAAVNRWTPIGPPGAYGFTRIHFDPLQAQVLYASVQHAGVWRSGDGGATWHPVSGALGSQPIAFAVDPHLAGGLYAVTARPEEAVLWRSVNSGATWSELARLPSLLSHEFPDLVPDPATPGTLYWLRDEEVYRSTDGGFTFQCFPLAGRDCGEGARPTAFALAPGSSTIYAASFLTFLKSADGGATWASSPITPFEFFFEVDRLVPTSDPAVVYAWSTERSFLENRPCFARSDDGGATWTGVLIGEDCGAPAFDRTDPGTVRIVVREDNRPSLRTSHDGGETWTKGSPIPAMGDLFLDSRAPQRLFLAGPDGFFMSPDGGETWLLPRRGPQASQVLLLEASPEAPGVLYAGTRSPLAQSGFVRTLAWGLWKSDNSGGTWTMLPLGSPEALAVDPADPRHLIAAAERRSRRGLAWTGIFESRNGGRTWKAILEKPLPAQANYNGPPRAQRLEFDPANPRTLYLGTLAGGFLKSTDGGRIWKPANKGLPFQRTCDSRFCKANRVDEIVVDPGDPRVLYITFEFTVFRSVDRGETWERASAGLPAFGVGAIAVDPDAPGVLYAGAGAPNSPSQPPGTVYRSVDGGRSWMALAPLPSASGHLLFGFGVADVRVTPAGLFVATGTKGVLRSVDDGQSWTAIPAGLAVPYVSVLEPDPFAPERLYAGTPAHGAYVARFP